MSRMVLGRFRNVIARSDSDEAIQIVAQAALDCFALLAMTR